jgi:hypothetical protein
MCSCFMMLHQWSWSLLLFLDNVCHRSSYIPITQNIEARGFLSHVISCFGRFFLHRDVVQYSLHIVDCTEMGSNQTCGMEVLSRGRAIPSSQNHTGAVNCTGAAVKGGRCRLAADYPRVGGWQYVLVRLGSQSSQSASVVVNVTTTGWCFI